MVAWVFGLTVVLRGITGRTQGPQATPHRLRYDAETTHHPPMDSPKPCPETWALHASAQIAAQAMNLARIYRSDSPAGCAESRPEVFAAMIQAQPLNRIADALAFESLERIARAIDARRAKKPQPASTTTTAPQEPPASDPGTMVLGTSQERHTGGSEALQGEGEGQGASEGAQAGQEGPVAASGGHPLDQGGWIRSRLPAEGDADEGGDVRVPVSNDWFWCSWRIVTPGQPWAPATTEPSPYTPKPLPAHLAYPSSQGWIHDRVPGPGDGDEDGDVVVACQGAWHWDGDPDTTDGPIRASAYAHWSHIVPGLPWRPFT